MIGAVDTDPQDDNGDSLIRCMRCAQILCVLARYYTPRKTYAVLHTGILVARSHCSTTDRTRRVTHSYGRTAADCGPARQVDGRHTSHPLLHIITRVAHARHTIMDADRVRKAWSFTHGRRRHGRTTTDFCAYRFGGLRLMRVAHFCMGTPRNGLHFGTFLFARVAMIFFCVFVAVPRYDYNNKPVPEGDTLQNMMPGPRRF